MINQILLSICIPTNGAVQWILPVLDSIYAQNCDLSKFEVIITDNGKDSKISDYLPRYNYPNLRYIPTTDEGFLNLVTSLKEGKALFCKMLNHRSVLLPGTISDWLAMIEKYKESQPIIYCSDGQVKGPDVIECQDMDQFLQNLSYWASWSAGIGFWKKDMDQIGRIHLDQMFPNASLLFNVRKDSQYVIWNKKYEQMSDDAGKGGYDLFDTFAVHFLDLIKELRDAQRISNETFEVIRKDLFGLLVKLYKNEKILPTKHTFILNNIKKSMKVYYGISGYYRMVLKAYLLAPIDICFAAASKIKRIFLPVII